ncbi:MAG: hypothetical protein K6A43_07040, partial [Treponema sp.]|nr:hypothetical protein [Treponema sp.]
KKNQITIDSDSVIENSIPLKKLDIKDLYYIDFKINGNDQYGFIDTGAPSLVLQHNYISNHLYSEADVFSLTEDDIIELMPKKDSDKNVKICIGELKTYCKGHHLSYEKIKDRPFEEKAFICTYNFLGNEVFKNHIIQMDFENMEFRIK